MITHVHRTARGIGRLCDCSNDCLLGEEQKMVEWETPPRRKPPIERGYRHTTAELEALAAQASPPPRTPWVMVVLITAVAILALLGAAVALNVADECQSRNGVLVRTLAGYTCVKLVPP